MKGLSGSSSSIGTDIRKVLTFFIVVSSLTAGSIILSGPNVKGLDLVQPIIIDGNSELGSHPEVDSGSGTANDPYIISDLMIDCRGSSRSAISIRNTTNYLVIRNVTIYASSSSPAINLRSLYSGGSYYSMWLTLNNVTVIGGGTHLEMYVPIRVIVNRCNFSNPSGSGKIFHSYSGYYNYFDNNTIDSPNMDIDLESTSYSYFTRNNGSIRYFTQNLYRVSDVSNNSFEITSMRLYSGYYSYFQGNRLVGRSPDIDVVLLYDCNRVMIANNTIIGGRNGMFVQHPNTYNPPLTYYSATTSLTFEYNLFNGTNDRGLYFYWATNHAYIQYMDVHHNTFRGCKGFAIEVFSGAYATCRVYLNIFMFNHGSDTVYSPSDPQARDVWSQFRWSNGIYGNYWHDWDNTDANSDGFSDARDYQLSSSANQADPAPLSNRYYDFEAPGIRLIKPSTRFLDNRYVNLTWEAWDNQTGIEMVRIRRGLSPWTNITGRDDHGLYLTQGQHNIDIRAIDGAGLMTTISINLIIEIPNEPISIISPLDGGHIGSNDVTVSLEFIPDLVPSVLRTSLDGGPWIRKEPISSHGLTLLEGSHTYSLNISDHYGNQIRKTISFTVDTTDPILDILYPRSGSVISNRLVNFQWDVIDLSGINRTLISIDGGEPIEVNEFTHSEFLQKGGHSFSVEVEDRAGNSAQRSMFFTISSNTSLHITAPLLDRPTNTLRHEIRWEYLTSLDISSLQVILDGNNPLLLPVDATSYEVVLSEEGEHDILVKAQDPAGNIFSDTITLLLDRTAPAVGFLRPKDGSILNRTEVNLEWSSLEAEGLDGYDLIIDGEVVVSRTVESSKVVILEPGQHVLSLKAHDLAGNDGEASITITIDTSLPDLVLLSPSTSVVTDGHLWLEWSATDDLGIDHYNYSIDGKPASDTGTSTSRNVQISEGQHRLVIKCIDLAGNVRTIVKEFIADLNPPEVEFTNKVLPYIPSWPGLIGWNITESVGISKINLTIDGIMVSLSTESRYHLKDLSDGEHTILIEVTDIGGWTDSDQISFILDTKDPVVSKGDPPEIKGATATIFWVLGENEMIHSMTLDLDGEIVSITSSPGEGRYTFTELVPGKHTANLTFQDHSSNIEVLNFEFEIERKEDTISVSKGNGLLFGILILIVVLVAAGIGALFFFRRKGTGGKKEDRRTAGPTLPKKPHRISIGAVPARNELRSAAPIASGRSHHPPAPHFPVDHGVKEEGYIRPEKRAKPVERTVLDAPHPAGPHIHGPKERRTSDKKKGWEMEDEVEDWSDMEEMEELEEMEEV